MDTDQTKTGGLLPNKTGERRGGRKKGTPNQTTQSLRQIGSDGKGRDGLVGYLRTLARKRPAIFAPLLARVLPYEVIAKAETPKVVYTTVEQARQAMLDRGFSQKTIDAIEQSMEPPWPPPKPLPRLQ